MKGRFGVLQAGRIPLRGADSCGHQQVAVLLQSCGHQQVAALL